MKCDRTTTTDEDIERGIVNVVIGFAPLKPAEFVVLAIHLKAGQVDSAGDHPPHNHWHIQLIDPGTSIERVGLPDSERSLLRRVREQARHEGMAVFSVATTCRPRCRRQRRSPRSWIGISSGSIWGRW